MNSLLKMSLEDTKSIFEYFKENYSEKEFDKIVDEFWSTISKEN